MIEVNQLLLKTFKNAIIAVVTINWWVKIVQGTQSATIYSLVYMGSTWITTYVSLSNVKLSGWNYIGMVFDTTISGPSVSYSQSACKKILSFVNNQYQ